MASVDGVRSLNIASDELFDHFCDPCKYDGNHKDGSQYCQDCEEYLCHNCVDSHKRFKTTRNHKILSVTEVSSTSAKPRRYSIICACEHNLEVRDFCEDHGDVFCQTCKAVKHRKCKTVSLHEKSASHEVSELNSVAKRIQTLQTEIKGFHRDRDEDMQKFMVMVETCQNEIRSFRRELDLYLKLLEENMLSELDKYAKQICQEIERHTSTCSNTVKLLEIDAKLLKEAKTSGNDDMIFASDVRVSNHLREFQLLLQDFQTEAQTPILAFDRNHNLLNIKNDVKTLGTLVVKECQEQNTDMKSLLDMKIESSRHTEIKLPNDKAIPWITGCVFMPDGQLLICDRKSNIKHLNHNLEIKGKLNLKEGPRDVAVVDGTTVIVTLPESKQLQFIQVVPNLEAGRVIQIDRECWGVDVVDDMIYTICHDNPGHDEVWVLQITGKIIRKIGLPEGQNKSVTFKQPFYLTLSKTSKQIYISDNGPFMLTCLTTDGTVVYTYKDPDLKQPYGIYVDDEDNVLIAGYYSNNIHTVTSDGKKHGLLVTSQDGLTNPISLAYRHSDDTLVIGCTGGKLAILKFSKRF